MSKVALLDCDLTGFPNLALMKLAAYHRAKGDEILPLNFIMGAEVVYASCVLAKNWRPERLPPGTVIGGIGCGSNEWLPDEIEHIMPDYSLYGVNYSVGFTSRGCNRRCPWCTVPQKEGKIKPWAKVNEFLTPGHKHLRLLDNNLLASPNCFEVFEEILSQKVSVDFNQGLDIRLVTPEIAQWLAKLKVIPGLRFSFDRPQYEKAVRRGIAYLKEAGISPSSLMFYVLCGFDSTPRGEEHRLRVLAELGCQAFPMFYREEPNIIGPISSLMIHGSRRAMGKWFRLRLGA